MTNQIAQTILQTIDPRGVAVVCEGTHLCMSMRGVEKQNSFAVTSAMLGIFRDNAQDADGVPRADQAAHVGHGAELGCSQHGVRE
jgi:GTP cyclohydrolase I